MPLRANIDPNIDQALEAYIAQSMPKVTKTAVVEAGLIEFLKKVGYWPWPKTPDR